MLLYVIASAMVFSFSAWITLLNNFAIEIASFDGFKIGILQSLREIPGLMAFSVVYLLLVVAQQKLTYISMAILGLGTSLTGFIPSVIGLYFSTVLMSFGFHYLETLNQSLSLQWLSKKEAPIFLGKINALKSATTILVLILIYIMMNIFDLEYKYVYLVFGGITFILSIVAFYMFDTFENDTIQDKSLFLRKEYWLYYVLTFLAGARRQIFVVFAGFLLVEKFGVDIHNMVIIFLINALINIYLAPKIGKYISKVGERFTLRLEYIGLIIVFVSYSFVDNLYIAYLLFIIDHLLFSMAIALKTYFQKIADPKDIASTSAVSFTINHIAAVFLPFLLGFIWLYSYSLVFLIGVVIAITSLSLSFLIPKEPRKGFETTLKI
jgi:hypothetical protein